MSLDYTTIRAAGGLRFDVRNPPAVGSTLVLQGGREMTYKGRGMAGMLWCADVDGIEQLVFPMQIVGVKPAPAAEGA
jgi:hypothetical protein